ncbi:hypothetical protein [Herbaspirillum sp. BH-1]|uniref:hypothetical protein n=1 Tax=Herbaspirillum sp. (strain BH-1) TaxID=2058884 RepID=UPI0011AF1695|nr:hypothetical protein [Herbaspirillum sp. BH-1]
MTKKKPPSLAVFRKFGFVFLRTLTAFHRRGAGIAKVKIKVSAGERHVWRHGLIEADIHIATNPGLWQGRCEKWNDAVLMHIFLKNYGIFGYSLPDVRHVSLQKQ